jgi:hypothetical protein
MAALNHYNNLNPQTNQPQPPDNNENNPPPPEQPTYDHHIYSTAEYIREYNWEPATEGEERLVNFC